EVPEEPEVPLPPDMPEDPGAPLLPAPPVPDAPELEVAPVAPVSPASRSQAARVKPRIAASNIAWEFFRIVLMSFLSLMLFIGTGRFASQIRHDKCSSLRGVARPVLWLGQEYG